MTLFIDKIQTMEVRKSRYQIAKKSGLNKASTLG